MNCNKRRLEGCIVNSFMNTMSPASSLLYTVAKATRPSVVIPHSSAFFPPSNTLSIRFYIDSHEPARPLFSQQMINVPFFHPKLVFISSYCTRALLIKRINCSQFPPKISTSRNLIKQVVSIPQSQSDSRSFSSRLRRDVYEF